MIIVIDGPAGSGKSSTSRAIADKLHIQYLDSGALYRAITWLWLESDRKRDKLLARLKRAKVRFQYADEIFHVAIDGTEVTGRLRDDDISAEVSTVAAISEVRNFVNDLMHQVVQNDAYIAEGRDLGTAVFPDARMKFFMTADVEERARRRYEELKQANTTLTLEDVKESIERRDQKDLQRDIHPLRKAADAIEIDTTNLSFEQQVDKICSLITKNTEL